MAGLQSPPIFGIVPACGMFRDTVSETRKRSLLGYERHGEPSFPRAEELIPLWTTHHDIPPAWVIASNHVASRVITEESVHCYNGSDSIAGRSHLLKRENVGRLTAPRMVMLPFQSLYEFVHTDAGAFYRSALTTPGVKVPGFPLSVGIAHYYSAGY